MWNYEKRLQYPVKITQTNPQIAKVIISQFGGPDGELAASMRYLSQRYTMPYKEVTATLTDIGTEELAHMEMICAIVHQLTKNLSPEEIERSGFAPYYVDHTLASCIHSITTEACFVIPVKLNALSSVQRNIFRVSEFSFSALPFIIR